MKILIAILLISSNLIYAQDKSDWEKLWLNKIGEPTLTELQEKIIFNKINDSLVPKSDKDSIRYKNKNYKAYNFEMYELKYQSAFGGLILYRIYGDGKDFSILKKTLSDPKYDKEDKFFQNKIQKLDSVTSNINKTDVDKYKSELEKYSFWNIDKYSNGGLISCLDGSSVTLSGLNGSGLFGVLIELKSTNCPKEKELPIQIERIFRRVFKL